MQTRLPVRWVRANLNLLELVLKSWQKCIEYICKILTRNQNCLKTNQDFNQKSEDVYMFLLQ